MTMRDIADQAAEAIRALRAGERDPVANVHRRGVPGREPTAAPLGSGVRGRDLAVLKTSLAAPAYLSLTEKAPVASRVRGPITGTSKRKS